MSHNFGAWKSKIKMPAGTSGQDGGIGRYTLPPHATKRRTTTNLKTKNHKNCQKIELYGNPTTKKLKKKHSSRLAGRVEMGSWQIRISHIRMQISREKQLGSEAHLTAQDSSVGKESLKTSGCENQWGGVLVGDCLLYTSDAADDNRLV